MVYLHFRNLKIHYYTLTGFSLGITVEGAGSWNSQQLTNQMKAYNTKVCLVFLSWMTLLKRLSLHTCEEEFNLLSQLTEMYISCAKYSCVLHLSLYTATQYWMLWCLAYKWLPWQWLHHLVFPQGAVKKNKYHYIRQCWYENWPRSGHSHNKSRNMYKLNIDNMFLVFGCILNQSRRVSG